MKTLARVTALAIVASLIALIGVPAASAGSKGKARTYEVTFTNVTENQILTPPVWATHWPNGSIFNAGTPASPELQEIAENGNLAPLAEALEHQRGIKASGIGGGADGPLFPGDVRHFEIQGRGNLISTASMVVCTNDNFTGIHSLKLPNKGKSVKIYVYAWDAGTEDNTNNLVDFVPPCSGKTTGTGMSNPDLASNGIIAPSEGVSGEASGFEFDSNAPVAVFEITRTK